MELIIFIVGFTIFVTYMFFLIRMINVTHKQQEKEEKYVSKQKVVKIESKKGLKVYSLKDSLKKSKHIQKQ
jgi:large-conductance mechanosensitive channel